MIKNFSVIPEHLLGEDAVVCLANEDLFRKIFKLFARSFTTKF